MKDSEKAPKGSPEEQKPSEETKRSRVRSIMESGFLGGGRKNLKKGADNTAKANAAAPVTSGRSAMGAPLPEGRERTLMLAKRYEQILDTRKLVEKATANVPVDVKEEKRPVSGFSLKNKTTAATSQPKAAAPEPRRSSPRPRIMTTADLEPEPREVIPHVLPSQGLKQRQTQGETADSVPRRPRCIIRRYVKEKIFPGKLILTISFFIVMVMMFIAQVLLNYITFNGRCMANVDYSNLNIGMPVYSPLGYVACERNLLTPASNRGTIGDAAMDDGFPPQIVKGGDNGGDSGNSDGPSNRLITIAGGLSTNKIRIYGESFRMWTSIFLHGGIWHIVGNMLSHLQLLYVIEPDWGFWRSLGCFMFAGYGGNLLHASMLPCGASVGASGSLFGLLGALLPYFIEHWDTLRIPGFLLAESLIFLILELMVAKSGVSTLAHIGGYICGLCFGFMTIKSLALFDRGAIYQRLMMNLFGMFLKEETKHKFMSKIKKAAKAEEVSRIQYESRAKANATRLRFVKRFFGIYPYGPYRLRLRDNIVRIVFLALAIAYTAYFYVALYNESFYTTLNSKTSMIFSKRCHCCYLRNDKPNPLANLHVSHLHGKYFCFQHEDHVAYYC